jgi:hypothetical protein
MDYSSVPFGGVNRYLVFFLDDCYSALILVREPVGDGGPEDPAADDGNVPGFQRRQEAAPIGEKFVMLYSGYALLSWFQCLSRQGFPFSLMFLRIVQYARAPIIARRREVARRLIRTPVSRGFPAKAEARRAPAARLRGLYSAIVATGAGRYWAIVWAG